MDCDSSPAKSRRENSRKYVDCEGPVTIVKVVSMVMISAQSFMDVSRFRDV